MPIVNELKRITHSYHKKQKKDKSQSNQINRKFVEAEASRLLRGWKQQVKEEAAKGWSSCVIVETGYADGVDGDMLRPGDNTTVEPGCPFDLIRKKMEKLGFKVVISSSYSEGSRSWDYDDAGWTYRIT